MADKKEVIYRCAKELFSLKGFKETNVADIMKMTGFATGTFYNYYPSKEALFMEIFNEENDKLKASIIGAVNPEGDLVSAVMEMLRLNMGMKSNPILREWYNRDVFEKLKQGHLEDKEHDHMSFMYKNFYEAIKEQQQKGRIRSDIGCDMIMAMFAALANIDTHKDEIGFEYFPELVHYMTEFVMKGLTVSPAKE